LIFVLEWGIIELITFALYRRQNKKMTTLVKAVYENGVLKPLKHLPLKEREKVSLLVTPLGQWRKKLECLLRSVHSRTRKFSSKEIEKDISLASHELRKNK